MSVRLFSEDVVFQQRFLKSAGLYTGALDGIWGPLTDAAFNGFLAQADQIAAEHGRFDGRSERNLASLQLPTQRNARRFMTTVLAAGFDVRIISGTRSYAEQNALFSQGRFGNPGPRVTNARGGFENGAYVTEAGSYDRVAAAGLQDGIEWGGHWTSLQDRPHYQLASPLGTSEIRARFEMGEPYF